MEQLFLGKDDLMSELTRIYMLVRNVILFGQGNWAVLDASDEGNSMGFWTNYIGNGPDSCGRGNWSFS